ncbi:MAG: hypothetical protein K6G37_03720 [Bacilli bacterium]|nr:hypothetical protein [Bacilli bacterium]
MGLFDKIKNVLFEEEEIEEEVETPKKEVENNSVATLVTNTNTFYDDEEVKEYKPLPDHKEQVVKHKEPAFEKVESHDFSERELFRSESTFKFPAFDEEEFETSMPREEEKKTSNVLDYERKNRFDKKSEYSRIDAIKSKEESVKEEKKRFKPSPVISPVYGILDKDYRVEDIKEAPKNANNNIISAKDLNVESVRAKAFGKLDEVNASKKAEKPRIVTETYEINKEEEKVDDVIISDEPIIEDSSKLMEERTRTIDELLKDASDDVIEEALDDDVIITDEPIIKDEDDVKEEYEKLEDIIDEVINNDDSDNKEETIEEDKKSSLENDTLENDLYDLIDSMYDNTEDGE